MKIRGSLQIINKTTVSSRRFISNQVSFTVRNHSVQGNTVNDSESGTKALPKLSIPLLKAKSHLGHYSKRMNRLYNEDKYSVNVVDLPMKLDDYGLDKWIKQSCFAASVFDGHGGDQTSTYLQNHLHGAIESCNPTEENLYQIMKTYSENIGVYWKRLYRRKNDIFKGLKVQPSDIDDVRLRLYQTYLEQDYKILMKQSEVLKKSNHVITSGSTGTTILLYNLNIRDHDHLYFNANTISRLHVSQIGDTKAIIIDKDGEAHALNSIHHPSSTLESERLNKYSAGFLTDSFGENRFLNFANTRAFGDITGKSKGLSAEPDITSYIIGDPSIIMKENLANETIAGKGGGECFIVLFSDGVSNFATDQEIGDLVMSTVNRKRGRATPQDCAEEIVKYVDAIGGDDNATAIVVRLLNWGGWPNLDRTGQLREDKLKDGISKMEKR
ncbi:hypothetical protein WICPIJ_001202 [Wickerhamomyces pijperi]|uniref:PPM-type phosphatase domain-containing protein n=1 Tax=Wickerhamomyces pijperi TaxID=599730 RepID=A0A9P8QB77_WICPI|nr:hypothetical protein WICPIJ_001202 [Wickerhamomyces pijperi]